MQREREDLLVALINVLWRCYCEQQDELLKQTMRNIKYKIDVITFFCAVCGCGVWPSFQD